MLKLPLAMSAVAIAIAGVALPAAPALAQNTKVSEIIVYGTDPCPRSTDDEIVVCARKPESERFRIPEALRQGGSLQSRQSWAARAKQFETVGRTGVNSCSPVGPGGFTGCMEQVINQAFNDREEQVQSESAPRQ
jgi:hypothetical protein